MTANTTLVGNLTRDPELRFSAKGVAWTSCGLAVHETERTADGSYEELPTEFFELVCFRDLAEHAAESLSKGSRVIATGRLEEDTWTGKDGAERTTRKLVVDDLGPSLRFATVATQRAAPITARMLETALRGDATDDDDQAPF